MAASDVARDLRRARGHEGCAFGVQQAGVDIAGAKTRMLEDGDEERDVRLDAEDRELAQRADEAPDGLVARCARGDDLGEQRVVVDGTSLPSSTPESTRMPGIRGSR